VSVVVDASLVVALVVTDERQQAVQTHLAAWLDAGEELHAPGVLPCSQRRRRRAARQARLLT